MQNGGRVTVGATKLGGGSGNAVTGTDEVVMSLRFRLLTEGVTDGSASEEEGHGR